GHCLPATFPGLAVREAARRRPLRPLVQSVCDRYHPTVEDFLAHVETERVRSGWGGGIVPARAGRIVPVAGGVELDRRPFAHVLAAPGHPGLAFREERRDDPGAVPANEPQGYGEGVCVVGAGLAAATEGLNAPEAGATVVSVRRREPVRRPLNV